MLWLPADSPHIGWEMWQSLLFHGVIINTHQPWMLILHFSWHRAEGDAVNYCPDIPKWTKHSNQSPCSNNRQTCEGVLEICSEDLMCPIGKSDGYYLVNICGPVSIFLFQWYHKSVMASQIAGNSINCWTVIQKGVHITRSSHISSFHCAQVNDVKFVS